MDLLLYLSLLNILVLKVSGLLGIESGIDVLCKYLNNTDDINFDDEDNNLDYFWCNDIYFNINNINNNKINGKYNCINKYSNYLIFYNLNNNIPIELKIIKKKLNNLKNEFKFEFSNINDNNIIGNSSYYNLCNNNNNNNNNINNDSIKLDVISEYFNDNFTINLEISFNNIEKNSGFSKYIFGKTINCKSTIFIFIIHFGIILLIFVSLCEPPVCLPYRCSNRDTSGSRRALYEESLEISEEYTNPEKLYCPMDPILKRFNEKCLDIWPGDKSMEF